MDRFVEKSGKGVSINTGRTPVPHRYPGVPATFKTHLSCPVTPLSEKAIYHWLASSVDISAYWVVGARPAHVQVRPVPWLDQTDEITALALREETITLTIFTHVYDRLNKRPIRPDIKKPVNLQCEFCGF